MGAKAETAAQAASYVRSHVTGRDHHMNDSSPTVAPHTRRGYEGGGGGARGGGGGDPPLPEGMMKRVGGKEEEEGGSRLERAGRE